MGSNPSHCDLGTTACACAKYSEYFMYNTPNTSNNDVNAMRGRSTQTCGTAVTRAMGSMP